MPCSRFLDQCKGRRQEPPEIDFRRLQLHLARFDLRQIEDVVDQRQQMAAALQDVSQILRLLLVDRSKVLIQNDFRKPDNGVQRRAQFMAHARQEVTLGPVGRFSVLLGLVDGLLQLFTFRHVPHRHEIRRDSMEGNFHAKTADPLFLSRCGDDLVLPGETAFSLLNRDQILQGLGHGIRVEKLRHVLPQGRIGILEIHKLCCCRVGKKNRSVPVNDDDRVQHVEQERPKEFLAFPEGFLRFPPLRHFLFQGLVLRLELFRQGQGFIEARFENQGPDAHNQDEDCTA